MAEQRRLRWCAVGHERAAMADCPICNKPEAAGFKPFCSKRCADVDLSRWLNGVYAIPAKETEEDDEEAEEG